jgi:hypothetical protein
MQQHQQQPPQQQTLGQKLQRLSSQTSCETVQAKSANCNAIYDKFVTFTVVEQIMTGLSGAVKE